MVKTATLTYGYENDDVLNDTISMFCVMFSAIGEIIGPLFVGFVTDFAGSEAAFNIASLMTFVFAIVFAVGTGVFNSCYEKQKQDQIFDEKEGIKNDLNRKLLT